MYAEHLALRRARADAIVDSLAPAGMLLAAGTPFRYHADDQHAPFRTNAHFAHWLPLTGSGHLLVVKPGRRPRLVRVTPRDYWHWHAGAAPEAEREWAQHFDIVEVADAEAAWRAVEVTPGTAYVGDRPDEALHHGVAPAGINPADLLARLDWDRACKTPYEIACMEQAQVHAARGHVAARAAFEAGASERAIHHAYVAAVGCVDHELPYESIIALDDHAATLHYTPKTSRADARVLLIDSGASERGYASDITRTWTRAGCDPLFEELRVAMDAVQRSLCELVRPGVPYLDLHLAAHRRIGDLLHALGILAVGGDAAFERGLTAVFFPHGLGHFLGLQVHDVGGRQSASQGGETPPPAAFPSLRTTRTLEPGHVVTIEPGVYFIDMLLEPLRASAAARDVDWRLVERLSPFGGVRIEDDVLVTEDGHRNLTRAHI